MALVGLVTKSCLTLVTPWIVTHQALLPMGFSRQEYWRGLPFLSPGIMALVMSKIWYLGIVKKKKKKKQPESKQEQAGLHFIGSRVIIILLLDK